jgi:hypothetical protein
MQPINYEQHCASCHQLSYSSLLAKTPLANNKPLPHVDPELINGILRDRLINYRKLQSNPTIRDPNQIDDFGATRNPAKVPLSEDTQSDWDWVEAHLPNMQALLFAGGKTAGQGDLQNGCALCHTFDRHQTTDKDNSIITARQSVNGSDILIASIKKCQSCHTDERNQTPAIARGRCVHCHDYHNDHTSGHKLILGNQ